MVARGLHNPKVKNMKRLLGLLLVLGVVGCGDPVAKLEDLGAKISRNEQGDVVGVELEGTQITDAGLVHLAGLTNLQELNPTPHPAISYPSHPTEAAP